MSTPFQLPAPSALRFAPAPWARPQGALAVRTPRPLTLLAPWPPPTLATLKRSSAWPPPTIETHVWSPPHVVAALAAEEVTVKRRRRMLVPAMLAGGLAATAAALAVLFL